MSIYREKMEICTYESNRVKLQDISINLFWYKIYDELN